jgi:hypothetical protein
VPDIDHTDDLPVALSHHKKGTRHHPTGQDRFLVGIYPQTIEPFSVGMDLLEQGAAM